MIIYTSPYCGNIPSTLTKHHLLLDIETTGLHPSGSMLYLIGMLIFQSEHWNLIQILNEDGESEQQVIQEFFELLSPSTILVHYNGTAFDLPYIKKRCEILALNCDTFCQLTSIDCYAMVRPLKKILQLPNCRQTTLEKTIGYDRMDRLSGRALIEQYFLYLKLQKQEQKERLLLHNSDDLFGLMTILHLTTLFPMNRTSFQFHKDSSNGVFTCLYSLPKTFPTNLFLKKEIYKTEHVLSLSIHKQQVLLTCPLIKTELKYFYKDYKNYYYLPEEDMAIHKNVATYVEKNYRQKAKASNCYIKKTGEFLPAFGELTYSLFYYAHHDKSAFFLADDLLSGDNNSKTHHYQWIQNIFRFFGLPIEEDFC